MVGGRFLLFMHHHHFVYSLWSLCYIFLHFFSDLCFVCSFLHSFVPLSFPSCLLCVFYMLGWKLGGCGCICTICSHICVLKGVYLTYFAIVITIGQDSSVKHVILIMCVNWHVISLASFFLYVSVGHIVCHFCIFVIFHMYHFWYMICHFSSCMFINANHTGMVSVVKRTCLILNDCPG